MKDFETSINELLQTAKTKVTTTVSNLPCYYGIRDEWDRNHYVTRGYSICSINIVMYNNTMYYGVKTNDIKNTPDLYTKFTKTIPGTAGIRWTINESDVKDYITFINTDPKQKFPRYYEFFTDADDVNQYVDAANAKHKIDREIYEINQSIKDAQEDIDSWKRRIESAQEEIKSYNLDLEASIKELKDFEAQKEQKEKELAAL